MPTPGEAAPSADVLRRYDPELLASLSSPGLQGTAETLDEQRLFTDEVMARFARASDAEVLVEDVRPGPSAPRLRVYRPMRGSTGGLLWLHGGAFALGRPEMDDDICRDAAAAHGLLVVAPDYRLAPEHPRPAAEEDCATALQWLATALADESPGSAPAVAGASAGGALALRTALDLVRAGGRLDRLLLVYPVVDASLSSASMRTYRSAPVFDAGQAEVMWDRYLGGAGRDTWPSPLTDPALPLLPPTLVVTTEHDPLRDEGLALVGALVGHGVPVEAVHLAGTYHAFDRFAPDTARAADLRAVMSRFLGLPLPRPCG